MSVSGVSSLHSHQFKQPMDKIRRDEGAAQGLD